MREMFCFLSLSSLHLAWGHKLCNHFWNPAEANLHYLRRDHLGLCDTGQESRYYDITIVFSCNIHCFISRLLGAEKVFSYALNEWLADIRKNQLPGILGGVGPMHSVVQLCE